MLVSQVMVTFWLTVALILENFTLFTATAGRTVKLSASKTRPVGKALLLTVETVTPSMVLGTVKLVPLPVYFTMVSTPPFSSMT